MTKRNSLIYNTTTILLVLLIAFLVRFIPASLLSVPEANRGNYLDEDGIPYLTEMDSYFYLRLASEMAETGTAFLYNQRGEDPLIGSRSGEDSGLRSPIFLSTLTYCLWRSLSLFFRVSIVQVARWMGPVFGSLAAVPAFFYVKRRTNIIGGITAALLAGLNIPFVSHTHAGFFDTDMMLAVLPLSFVLLQLRAMQERTLRRQVVCGICSGFLLSLLSIIWYSFFVYYWLLVLGGLVGALLVICFAFKCPLHRRLLVIRGWFFSILPALFFVLLFRGATGLGALFEADSLFRSVSETMSAFPFVYRFTGEMQPLTLLPESGDLLVFLRADYVSGLGSMGGLIPCLLAVGGFPLALLTVRRKNTTNDRENNRDALIAALAEAGMLLVWLGCGIVLMGFGKRFAEIAVLPVAILAGLAVGFFIRLIQDRIGRGEQPNRKNWKNWLCISVSVAMIVGCCLPSAIGTADLVRSLLPSVTDSMNDAMIWILQNTPENAAIAGWWDDGYFMQYRARRRTIADGGTGSSVANYYLGKALTTEDPVQMRGIFRMLETSALAALDDLIRHGAGQEETVEYLLKIASLSREEAAQTTPPGEMTEKEFEIFLDRTHPKEKIPLLLVLSEDLLWKTGAISFYGFWDVNTQKQTETSYCLLGTEVRELAADEEAVFTVQGSSLVLRVRKDPIGLVQTSLEINGESYSAGRICCWKDGEKTQDLVLSGEGPAVVLSETEGRTSALVCSQNLCNSMLVRLLFCGERTAEGVTLAGTWEYPLVQVWEIEE